MNPTLGVVIPFHNQWNVFPQSLESIYGSDVEKVVVIVDDNSESNFSKDPGKLSKEAQIRGQLFVISLEPNQGVQFSRNIGYYMLRRFNCKYTLFSDSDVIWHKGALDKLVGALERSGDDIAYCDYNRGSLGTWIAGEWSAERLRKENYMSTMSVIRTKALEFLGNYPFDEKVKRLQDWDLWLALLSDVRIGTYVPEVLFSTEFSAGCISQRPGYQEAVNFIKEKHGLA